MKIIAWLVEITFRTSLTIACTAAIIFAVNPVFFLAALAAIAGYVQ